jgi:hypothetical protein
MGFNSAFKGLIVYMVVLYIDICFWFYNPLGVRSHNELQYVKSTYYIRIMKFLNLGDKLSPSYDVPCMKACWEQLEMKTSFRDKV